MKLDSRQYPKLTRLPQIGPIRLFCRRVRPISHTRERFTFWDGLLEQPQLVSDQSGRGSDGEPNTAIGDRILASAMQLDWLIGSKQLPREQVEAIVGVELVDQSAPPNWTHGKACKSAVCALVSD